MQNIWKNWPEFNQIIKNKEVVFFGVAEDWFAKTLKKSDPNLIYIVDNSESRIGKKQFVNEKIGELEVKSPKVLKDKGDDVYVVITSGAYRSIVPQLESFGLKKGKDFCCSPALNNLKVISDIDACKTKLLVCSPDHKIYSELDKSKITGGGLYLYDIADRTSEKVFAGTIHNIIDAGDRYYVLDEVRCVLVLSKEFELIREFGFEMNAKTHGLAYDAIRNQVFVGKTDLSKVSVYNADNYKLEFEIQLSDKYSRYKQDQHHLNDLCVKGDYLYVSLFSFSGNWQRGIFDGGILEIDLNNPDKRRVVISGAWMPHSACFIGGDLCYLDSMRGKFYKGAQRVAGTFGGNFIRGLAFDGKYYYIGTSESRYFNRLKGMVDYISMNGGFYLFDDESKAGKFFDIPQVRQVRNLIVYKD